MPRLHPPGERRAQAPARREEDNRRARRGGEGSQSGTGPEREQEAPGHGRHRPAGQRKGNDGDIGRDIGQHRCRVMGITIRDQARAIPRQRVEAERIAQENRPRQRHQNDDCQRD